MSIPVLDLHNYISGSKEERIQFVRDLGLAFEQVGFVGIVNHGLSEIWIDRLYDVVKKYFGLPLAQKKNHEVAGLAGQRGYTSFGREHAKGSEAHDLKEFFQFGQITGEHFPSNEEYPENVRVKEVPEFNETLEKIFKLFEISGSHLLRAISEYLSLPTDYFDGSIERGNSILRAIHYPPITEEPKNSIRAEQHEDINLITLLIGASADGLEILNKKGEWLPVTATKGQIVINVGDMLQRLTNNKLRSTTHRVVNPPRDLWHTSRFSIPFFLHPKGETSLACLDSCITENVPKAYEDITAGEYLNERLREIGLKK